MNVESYLLCSEAVKLEPRRRAGEKGDGSDNDPDQDNDNGDGYDGSLTALTLDIL